MGGGDLISREALLEFARNHINKMIDCNDIARFPAVDAEPVRHGRLVSTGTDELYCEWGDCTVCGSDNRINAKFCNNCGAKIEGIVTK